jgi:alkylated DNA repair protein alkB family protein 6
MSDHQNPVIGSTAGLEEFRIQSLPSAAYYIPDFITKEEEKIILNKVSVHRF